MSFGQWLSTLSSYSVSMNYPPASQRHTAVQDRETSREAKDGVSLKEREEEVMAHFTQCTEEITGGLQTWHGDVSANNLMQICHLQRNWGQGGTQSSNRGTQMEKCFILPDQKDIWRWYYRNCRHVKLLSPHTCTVRVQVTVCYCLCHMLDFWSAMSYCILATQTQGQGSVLWCQRAIFYSEL